VTDANRQFGTVVFIAAIGILGNGMTSIVFSSNVLAYVFFWMVGALVTVSEPAIQRSAPVKPLTRPASLGVVTS
jgi:hypothetical protein